MTRTDRAVESGGIGASVLRKEDARFLVGEGRYCADIVYPGQVHAFILRSPHAHALVRSVDVAASKSVPGVMAVLTAEDLRADGLKPLPYPPWSAHPVDLKMPNRDGSAHFLAPYALLAGDRTRFVGEAVAMVVAETLNAARDGAEAIVVDYEPLAAVTQSRAAAAEDAPRLWNQLASNTVVDADVGDAAATGAAFAAAAHVARLETQVNRVTGVPLEPRAALGLFDHQSGRYTVYGCTAGSIRMWQALAAALNVDPQCVRAVVPDVGGSFGTRAGPYPEFALVAWAAKRIGRPVQWVGERIEIFMTDFHGRDLWVRAELALDTQGTILAMRGESISNVGAFNTSFVPLQKSTEIMSGIYKVPVMHWHPRGVFSNTTPTFPYRSTGRPEAMFVIERLLETAAREGGFDRLALRRRNLIPASAMPYTNAFGIPFDSGHYHEAFESALALGDWNGFPQRREAARRRGLLRGIGCGTYIETATGSPRERVEITVRPEGIVDLAIGTTAHGQGHETAFGQLLTEWLGVPLTQVRLIASDTDLVKIGGGSSSGRSMRLASLLAQKVTTLIVERATEIASHLLEAAPTDIRFAEASFTVAGTDRAIGLFEVAAAALEGSRLPKGLRGPLAADCDEVVTVGSFPYGAHVCEVEIDPETGALEIASYAAVDDVGRAINPMMVHGQTHGGIAQGVGQALWERIVFDPGNGQPVSASFMDYAMPRASSLPFFKTQISEVPSSTHPLGVRSGSEGGTAPALAAVGNAVIDALAEFGVSHLELPFTPERIWSALREAAS